MTVRALAFSSVALAALLVLAPAGAASAVPPDYTIITTIPVGASAQGIAVNYVTNRIYVSNTVDGTVSVIDGATNAVIATIPGFSSAVGIAVNSLTNRIYVSAMGTANLRVIDGGTNAIIADVPVGGLGYGVAVDESTNKIFVSDGVNSTLYTVDGLTLAVVTAPVGVGAFNVIANAGTVYVANNTSNTITVVDAATNMVKTTLTSAAPYTLDIDPVGHVLYVSSFFFSEILRYDTVTNAPLLPSISSGSNPGVGFDPTRNVLHAVTNSGADLEIYDATTQSLWQTLAPIGTSSFALAVNRVTGAVYVANGNDNTVTVIAPPYTAPAAGLVLAESGSAAPTGVLGLALGMLLLGGAVVAVRGIRRRSRA